MWKPNRNDRRTSGQAAEDAARRHLGARGLKVIRRNYQTRRGEIDLVMRDGDTLVFVEVRSRGRGAMVSPAESVDARKQRRLIAAAEHFLTRHPRLADRPTRFDVVAIDTAADPPAIRWIRDAFGL